MEKRLRGAAIPFKKEDNVIIVDMELSKKHPELVEIMMDYKNIFDGILKGLKIVDDLPVTSAPEKPSKKVRE